MAIDFGEIMRYEKCLSHEEHPDANRGEYGPKIFTLPPKWYGHARRIVALPVPERDEPQPVSGTVTIADYAHHIGFTGTREGMTEQQLDTLDFWLEYVTLKLKSCVSHHGDCVGADAQFHFRTRSFGFKDVYIHPPSNGSKRANCHWIDKHAIVLPEQPYLERNRVIVDASELMLAAPKSATEDDSGTWATIRYSKQVKCPIILIKPDGDWQSLIQNPPWCKL